MEKEINNYENNFLKHIERGNIQQVLEHLYQVRERCDKEDWEFSMKHLPVTEELVKKHVKEYYKLAHHLSELAYATDARYRLGPTASFKAGIIIGMIHRIKDELLTKNNNNESDSRTD